MIDGDIDIRSGAIDFQFGTEQDGYTAVGKGTGRFYGRNATEIAGEFLIDNQKGVITKGIIAAEGDTDGVGR